MGFFSFSQHTDYVSFWDIQIETFISRQRKLSLSHDTFDLIQLQRAYSIPTVTS